MPVHGTAETPPKIPLFVPPPQDEDDLQSVLYWLESRGIHGLCHPAVNDYAPAFPKCEYYSRPEKIKQRFLGQQYNYNYNDNDGDTDDSSSAAAAAAYQEYQDQYNSIYGSVFDKYYGYNNDDNQVPDIPVRTKWYYIRNGGLAFLCVVGGALASGLTVGLLSLDPLLLAIKMRGGQTPRERQQAADLLPLIKQHHRLMVTLLLANTIAGEALPVFLQGMVSDSLAIIASVVLVLVFGEILPTALFTGPNQLQIASRLAPIVRILMTVLYPITYPIAKLLDHIMNHEDHDDSNHDDNNNVVGGTLYNRGELAALIRLQYEQRVAEKQRRKRQRNLSLATIPDLNLDTSELHTSEVRALKQELIQHQVIQQHLQEHQSSNNNTHSNSNNNNNNNTHNHGHEHRRSDSTQSIHGDEVLIMEGALQLKTKTACDVYLSYHKVFCIQYTMKLNDANIFKIYASGYSRVPVYVNGDRRRVKGILMTRQLMVVERSKSKDEEDPEHKIVADLKLHVPQCVAPQTNLVELVNLFQTGGSVVRAGHMALVCARPDIANEALDRNEAVPEEAGLMGIITLEDVLEALLQEQILDEMDVAGRMPVVHETEPEEDPGGYKLVL